MKPCDDGRGSWGLGTEESGVPPRGLFSLWEVGSEVTSRPTSYGEVAGKGWWGNQGRWCSGNSLEARRGSLPRLQNTICAVPPMELGWGGGLGAGGESSY